MPRVGMATFSPCSTSATLRLRRASCTADLISARARARKRCRLLRLLPLGLGRRSTMFIGSFPAGAAPLASLVHPHVPLDEPADLALSIAALHHPLQEVGVLFLGLGILLGPEADDRQQILDLGEHAPLDHLAQLFVGGPGGIAPAVIGARAQRELDDLVAEVLRIGDARRLLD